MAKSELITFSEFGKRIGVTKQMVSRAKRDGIFEKAIVFQDGKKLPLLKFPLAKKLYDAAMDPNFRKARQIKSRSQEKKNDRSQKPAGDSSFAKSRAETEFYKAKEKRLQWEIKQGQWIKKSDVKNQAFRAARLARESLLNIAARVSPLVAAESDQSRCFAIIQKEIKDVLTEYVRQLSNLSKIGADAKE